MNDTSEDLTGAQGAVPFCRNCQSEDVVRDAWVIWNAETGLWELLETFEDGYCRGCEQAARTFGWKRTESDRTARIRQLNDALRRGEQGEGQVVITAGVHAQGERFLAAVVEAVTHFDDFSADNDPHGEHDFGSVDVMGQKVFFKVDYYDPGMTRLSDDPADPSLTRRVLTIMLAHEY